MRKQKIAHLRAEIDCNNVLLPRWRDLTARLDPSTNENPQATYNEVVEKLKINPSPDAPPTNKPGQPTYDDMILSLLLQVGKEAKESAGEGSDVGDKLKELMNKHVKELGAQIDKLQKELDAELHEQKKHITSEDLHVGFDNKVSPSTSTSLSRASRVDNACFAVCAAHTNPARSSRCRSWFEIEEENDGDYLRGPQSQVLFFKCLPA
jgi:cell division cycle protein 37